MIPGKRSSPVCAVSAAISKRDPNTFGTKRRKIATRQPRTTTTATGLQHLAHGDQGQDHGGGLKIEGQIYYHDMGGDFDLYASGKYQNNTGIQPSLMYRDFEKDE